jgi:hypothetical protein
MSKQIFSKLSFQKLTKFVVIISIVSTIGSSITGLSYYNYFEAKKTKAEAPTAVSSSDTSSFSSSGISATSTSSLSSIADYSADSTKSLVDLTQSDSNSSYSNSENSVAKQNTTTDAKVTEGTETLKLDEGKQLTIPASGSKFGEIKISIPKDTVVKANIPVAKESSPNQNPIIQTGVRLFGLITGNNQYLAPVQPLSYNTIKADENPEVTSDTDTGDSIKFEFGDPAKHLTFSSPVQVSIPVDAEDFTDFEVKVKHVGDQDFGFKGLTTDPTKGCDSSGNVIDQTAESHHLYVIGKNATFFTCGASTFTVNSIFHTQLEYIYPSNGSKITSNYPTISGQVLRFIQGTSGNSNATGATINLSINGNVIGTTVSDNGGRWSITPTSPLPDGPNTICGDSYYTQEYIAFDTFRSTTQRCITININPKNLDVNLNPSVINYDSGSPTPILLKAIFSKSIDVASFDPSDIVLSGTATGKSITSITEIAPFDKTTFNITGQATGSGTIAVDIPASSFTFANTPITNQINYFKHVEVDVNNNIFVLNQTATLPFTPINIVKIDPSGNSTILANLDNSFVNDFKIDSIGNIYVIKFTNPTGLCGYFDLRMYDTSIMKIDPSGNMTLFAYLGAIENPFVDYIFHFDTNDNIFYRGVERSPSCGGVVKYKLVSQVGLITYVSTIPTNLITNTSQTYLATPTTYNFRSAGAFDTFGNYFSTYPIWQGSGYSPGPLVMKYADGRSIDIPILLPNDHIDGLLTDSQGNLIVITQNQKIYKIIPQYQGILSLNHEYNFASHSGDNDVTGIVGTQFPIIPFGDKDTQVYNNQIATFKVPNNTGGFSNVTGKILYNSFIPDDGQIIPADSKISYSNAKISIGVIDVNIQVNFSPVGGANILGSQTITAPYLTTNSNFINFQIGAQAPNIQLTNSNIPNGTTASLTFQEYFYNGGQTKVYQGTIQNGSFVPNPNQIVDNSLNGKLVAKLSTVGGTTGVLANFKSLAPAVTPSSVSPFISTPIGGAAGDPFPSFPIGGTTLDNGDVLTISLPGSATIINGTYQGGFFVPNAGSIIPLDVPNVTSGYLYGQLTYNNQSINIATNFTNANSCDGTSGGGGPIPFLPLNLFTSINVLAQTDTAGGGPTISVSDCGLIYTPTTVTISVPPLTNNPKPPITGTCITGDNLTVTVTPTNESFSGIICANSTYTVTPTVTIPDGVYCGNVLALNPTTILTAPGSSATAQSCGIINTTTYITVSVPPVSSDPKPNITGTCEAGGQVTITITNGNPSTNALQSLPAFICPTIGTYSIIPTVDIPNGPYCANGHIVDTFGNTADSFPVCGLIDNTTYITTLVPTVSTVQKPFINGTCEVGGSVTITITIGTPSTNVQQTLPSFTCDNTGIYSVFPSNPIPNGPYCANGHIVDVSNNIADSTPGCGVIDTATFVTVSVPPVTYGPRPTITGTCETGGIVTITITNGNPSTNLLQTLSNFTCVGGTYSIIPPADILRGDYCANASIVDLVGNTATAIPSCGRIDLGQFLTILVPATSTNPKPTLTGTCEMGNAVTVSITNGTPSTNVLQTLPQFTCPASETYSIVPQANIPDGPYCGNAVAIDTLTNGGTAQPTSFTAIPSCGIINATTFITVSVPLVSSNQKPTITGTCEAGGVVTLVIWIRVNQGPNQSIAIETQSLPSFTCSATGTYSVSPQNNIPAGEYCARGKIVDGSGNIANAESCGSINLTTSVSISVPVLTNNPKPTIIGTCVSGNSLTVTITPSNETRANIPCPSNGVYSLTPNTAIPDGNYCASISASGAGGGGPVLSYLDFIYNIFGSITVSAQSATAGPSCGVIDTKTIITTSILPLASTATPTITGTCETGAVVSLNITFGNPSQPGQVLTPFVCEGGVYSIPTTTPIVDGPYCAIASALETLAGTNPVLTNSAGPVQSCGIIDTTTFITVTVPPITSDPTPTITGTCEPLGVVTIRITNGAVSASNPTPTVIQTLPNFTCANTGTYSVIPTTDIPNGPYCANGRIIDAAGNTANSIPGCGVVDTGTFVTIVVPPITANPRPNLTGICEPNANLIIKIYTGTPTTNLFQTLPQFTCPLSGNYISVPIADIPQGLYCASVDATDLAGNTAFAQGCGDIFVSVSVPEQSVDPKPEIVGTCTPSIFNGFQVPVKVVIKVDTSTDIFDTINTFCSIAGTYRVFPNNSIPIGQFTAIATATDSAGNEAVGTDTGTIIAPIINGGGIITIKEVAPIPESFELVSDPYECGKSITGVAKSNYGIKSVVVKLYKANGNGAYETNSTYIFRPTIAANGNYEILPNYIDESIFVKTDYRVEYISQSNKNTIKSGSYLARITDQCTEIITVIIESTPEPAVTIRTGGNNELYYVSIILALIFFGIGYWKLRKKEIIAYEVFR